jgi:N-succinyldiaminopimelate aminotransferase
MSSGEAPMQGRSAICQGDDAGVATSGAQLLAKMTTLAAQHNAIDLVQGHSDISGPPVLAQALQSAVDNRFNQYSEAGGLRALKLIVARLAMQCGYGRYDPDQEVLIATGCTAALYAAARALISPGDEVIIFEPFWHLYPPIVRAAGGVPVALPLARRDGRYRLDGQLLRAAVGARTRMLLVNSPHNPTGMVLDRQELQLLADVAIANDLIVLSDQVYEFLTFDDSQAGSIATLPGMRQRTVIVSSASKTLSITGWRVGWALAPRPLMAPIESAHILLTYCAPTPLQLALAHSLEWAMSNDYLPRLRQLYGRKRDLLFRGLRSAGFDPAMPEGGFFITAQAPCLNGDDVIRYCVELVNAAGVAVLPARWFFDRAERAGTAVRVSFCKLDDALDGAVSRLKIWQSSERRHQSASVLTQS